MDEIETAAQTEASTAAEPMMPADDPSMRRRTKREQDRINRHFGTLAALLKGRQLKCEYGGTREVDADEFMLMSATRHELEFKHSATRNYVVVRNGVLDVPETDEPFMRGFFDDL